MSILNKSPQTYLTGSSPRWLSQSKTDYCVISNGSISVLYLAESLFLPVLMCSLGDQFSPTLDFLIFCCRQSAVPSEVTYVTEDGTIVGYGNTDNPGMLMDNNTMLPPEKIKQEPVIEHLTADDTSEEKVGYHGRDVEPLGIRCM